MQTTDMHIAGYPPVLNVLQLAELIHKTPQSVLADRSRAPHRLPPSCEPPGTKSPLWLLTDVLDWLRHYQRVATPPPAPAAPDVPRRRGPGRPTKAEQARRARLNAELDRAAAEIREREQWKRECGRLEDEQ